MPLRSGVFTGCAQPNRSNDSAPSLGRCAPGRDSHQDGPTLLLQAPSERFFPQPRHGARSSAPSSSDSTLSGLPGRQAPGSNKTDDFFSYQPRSSNASSPTATNASSSPAPPPHPSNDYNFFIILNTFLWLSRDFKSTLFLLALSTTQLHPPT